MVVNVGGLLYALSHDEASLRGDRINLTYDTYGSSLSVILFCGPSDNCS